VTDDLIDIIITIGQPKIHSSSTKFHIINGLSISSVFVNGYIIESHYHFFNDTLTGAMYNDFLQNTLPQLLEDVDFVTRQCLWMQQNALPHYTRNVRNTLNQMFPNRKGWSYKLDSQIARFNIFSLGLLEKYRISQEQLTIDDMRMQIRMACASIP